MPFSHLFEKHSDQGLYVAAFFSNETNKNITDYTRKHNIPNPVSENSLHTTIVYSRSPVEFEPIHSVDAIADTEFSRLECWDLQSGGRCLVWVYDSAYLHLRFVEAIKAGATYDFDEYKPHITLSYDVPDTFDVSSLPTPNFPIEIVGEYSEPLDLTK